MRDKFGIPANLSFHNKKFKNKFSITFGYPTNLGFLQVNQSCFSYLEIKLPTLFSAGVTLESKVTDASIYKFLKIILLKIK